MSINLESREYNRDTGFLHIHKDDDLEIKMKLEDLGAVYEFEKRYDELSDVG